MKREGLAPHSQGPQLYPVMTEPVTLIKLALGSACKSFLALCSTNYYMRITTVWSKIIFLLIYNFRNSKGDIRWQKFRKNHHKTF